MAKRSHVDKDVHVDQEDHADICGSASDVLHISDVESSTAVQTSLTQDELSSMERKLVQLKSENKTTWRVSWQYVSRSCKMIQDKLDEVAFPDNNAKVTPYTGGLSLWLHAKR